MQDTSSSSSSSTAQQRRRQLQVGAWVGWVGGRGFSAVGDLSGVAVA
jgi:hypothetical protein